MSYHGCLYCILTECESLYVPPLFCVESLVGFVGFVAFIEIVDIVGNIGILGIGAVVFSNGGGILFLFGIFLGLYLSVDRC